MTARELPLLRLGRPADVELTKRRQNLILPIIELDDRVTVLAETVGGIPVVTCTPPSSKGSVIYLHGGGFRLGSVAGWTPFAVLIAARTRLTVTLVDYRLAPEHPFPAALHDIAAVYDARADRGSPTVIAGDSAGGGLALSFALLCHWSGRPRPEGVALLSPWLDLTVSAASYRTKAASDLYFSAGSARAAAADYLQGWDPYDPLVSPLLADPSDLAGCPPTFVTAGTDEVLLDDSVRFLARMASAGQTVRGHIRAGGQHVWPMLDHTDPSSLWALDEIGRLVTGR